MDNFLTFLNSIQEKKFNAISHGAASLFTRLDAKRLVEDIITQTKQYYNERSCVDHEDTFTRSEVANIIREAYDEIHHYELVRPEYETAKFYINSRNVLELTHVNLDIDTEEGADQLVLCVNAGLDATIAQRK